MNIISVNNLSFSYSNKGPEILHNISFNIEEGSYTAIVGSNGSGKSTIAKLICGLLPSEKGNIDILENTSVGLVFQSPKDQLVSSIVYRDTAFGPQNLKLHKSEIELRTIECLNIVEMLDKAKKSTSSISLGQTQKVALSGMLAIWPKVLIMDEAVSMLDPESRENIFEFLKYWHKKGNTIIHITHDLDAIAETNKVISLEKGNIVFNGSKEEFFNSKVLLDRIKGPKLELKSKIHDFSNYEPSVQFKNISFHYNKDDEKSAVHNIDFTLYKGTVTALTGPSGAGKSTILELCAGLLSPDVVDSNIESKILCNVKPALTFQNCSNALFEAFAADDVAFGPINLGVKGSELKHRVIDSMNKVNLPFEEFGEKATFQLSGGQQRRLAIAGIIALNRDVILFDEPSAGLDGYSRYEVMSLLQSLAREGKTVLFSTHQKDEAAFADREINVHQGRIVFDSCQINNTKVQLNELEVYNATSTLTSFRKLGSNLSGENKKKKAPIEFIPSFLRILLFLLLFIGSQISQIWWLSGIFVLIGIGYGKLCGIPIRKMLLGFLKISPFILFFSIFQFILRAPLEGETLFVDWGWFSISMSKILYSINGVLRTFCGLSIISGFFTSTPEFEFIDGLKKILFPFELCGIPVRYLILIIEVIFRFIPLLIDETYSIMKTQIMRGGLGKAKGFFGKVKAMLPLFVPLIIQTIRRSEALAEAITMRCFK